MMIIKTVKKDHALSEVIPGLYIGSIGSIVFSKQLKEIGITHILSAMKNATPIYVSSYNP